MLSRENRMRASADFSKTVRSGARSGRRNLVLYVLASRRDAPSTFGFIVSKGVGNAVVRNLVKRRLREAAAAGLGEYGEGFSVVVRALPAASSATWDDLNREFHQALSSAVIKHRGRHAIEGAPE